MKKVKGIFKILFHITFVLLVTILAAQPILLGNAEEINQALGIETEVGSHTTGNTYFNTKYKNMAEMQKASCDVIEETMKEGAVLIKNKDNALPLQKQNKVNLYGAASHYTVCMGQGSSGNGSYSDNVTLYTGLTNAGLNVNKNLDDWYAANGLSSLGGNDFCYGSGQKTQFVVKDIAWNNISSTAKNDQADAAIVVFGRNSGEAVDLYMDVTMDDNSTRVILNKNDTNKTSVGDGLSLANNEKDVLTQLNNLKKSNVISKIIVLMNTATPMQCEFLDDDNYGIDACLWVGTIGSTGANAIGKLLTGEYNPSGKTADTFWKNSKYNPVYYNFGEVQYGNSSILQQYYANNAKYYAAYQEGIYNGYKYTETRYEDTLTGRANTGSFDYSKVVAYPFGYGLSYTNFTYSNYKVEDKNDGTYEVSVDVTNNTDVAGKEAVEIYVQKPYTAKDIENGIEKAAVELVGYEKVSLAGKEKKTVKSIVEEKYFTSYDSNVEKTYVIGSSNANDKYLLTVAKDAHDAENNILQYKSMHGTQVNKDGIVKSIGRDAGNSALVWEKYIAYDNTKYSTNEFIKSENDNFTPSYEGQKANYGVSKITNQFDNADFTKANIFSEQESNQSYMTRNNWNGTYGKRIKLTANDALKQAQVSMTAKKDDIPYPTYGETGFYEGAVDFDEIKLIYLRGKDYNDPLWDTLLNRITWEETCDILENGKHITKGIPSIAAPSSLQENGCVGLKCGYSSSSSQSGFRGFGMQLDKDNCHGAPPLYINNGIVAATYNKELIQRLGEEVGENCAWFGVNGLYGFGANMHRGGYNGRAYEYYSEDSYLGGVCLGYETIGLNKSGTFVVAKHAILNDQETYRAGLNVWANEQSIREIYARVVEIAINLNLKQCPNSSFNFMTGMNRIGTVWAGGQGFCDKVLRAEFGMKGFVVSDYNSFRPYMGTIQGVLMGNDLPDGEPTSLKHGYDYDGYDLRFTSYSQGYGELAWKMRAATKNVLYTVVNSNTVNGVTGDTSYVKITPAWEIALPISVRMISTLFIWCSVVYLICWCYDLTCTIKNKKNDMMEERK